MTDAWLATKHGKVDQIAPAFRDRLGWEVGVVEVDTDQWGTFTPEVPRLLTPHDAALAKARRAIELTGATRGLGSEGTVGPHPVLPFTSALTEHLALVDHSLEVEVVHRHTSSALVAFQVLWSDDTDIDEVARLADLPHHAVIARSQSHPESSVKGIRQPEHLSEVVTSLRHQYPGDQVVVESDFRAMMSPSRQEIIRQCAEAFANRLTVLCPACGAPYWGRIDVERGLPCSGCGLVNPSAIRADLLGCCRCEATELVAREVTFADPATCERCNP